MKNLSFLRNNSQMSQLDLAEKLGVSQQTISKYERGTREPDHGTLIKLSRIFGVSIDILLNAEADGIGDAIREEREDQGLSVKELADELQISVKEILQYEANDIDISNDIADRIANTFGMSWVEFLDKYGMYDEYIPPQFDNDVMNDIEVPQNITLAAHKTDGYDDDLTEDEMEIVKSVIEGLKKRRKDK